MSLLLFCDYDELFQIWLQKNYICCVNFMLTGKMNAI